MLNVKLNGCFCVCKNKMEEFRELPEYPGYKIGNMGTVIGIKGGVLSQKTVNGPGYSIIKIHGEIRTVHRLVGHAWIPNPDNKKCIDHINHVRTDNRVCNLRWATYIENGENHSISKRSKTGVNGLIYDNTRQRWMVCIKRGGIIYQKRFKEREEAELYLQEIMNTH